MPRYLVESYLIGPQADFDDVRERARRTAELGESVRYVRTTFLPDDDTLFHLFEAPSADALRVAGGRAALRFDRIVEAIEVRARPAIGDGQRIGKRRVAEPGEGTS